MRPSIVVLFVLLLAAMLTVPQAAQAATTPFSGYTGSGQFLMPYTTVAIGDFNFQPCGHDYDAYGPLWYYDVQPFYVTESGPYTITILSSTFTWEDSVIVLYRDQFDPAAPHTNCLGMNDEYTYGPPYLSQILNYPFVADVQYFLIVVPYDSGTRGQGTYSGSITGTAGTPNLGYVPAAQASDAAIVERPPDDRLNWRRGDMYAALYLRSDDAGEPALHLYCVNDESQGYLGAVWGADDLVVPAPLPATNVLVASVDICTVPVSLYLLTSGEWALHIGPNATGDVHALLWTGMPPVGMYEVRYNTTR